MRTITFRAWDQSKGVSGGTFDIAHSTDPAGTSPFSTATATATQTINFVNQSPTFVRGPTQSILNTAGAQTIASWATNIGPGAANESTQALNFIVSNNNAALFTPGGQPSIDPATGTLTYTPAAGADGTATVTVQLHDNGGTLNGGNDTSLVQTFQISVTPVGGNRPPVNTIPFARQTTLENQPISVHRQRNFDQRLRCRRKPDAVGNYRHRRHGHAEHHQWFSDRFRRQRHVELSVSGNHCQFQRGTERIDLHSDSKFKRDCRRSNHNYHQRPGQYRHRRNKSFDRFDHDRHHAGESGAVVHVRRQRYRAGHRFVQSNLGHEYFGWPQTNRGKPFRSSSATTIPARFQCSRAFRRRVC